MNFMKMKKNINKDGFTILELLVVIAIIAVLATISMLLISDSQNKSKDSKIKSQMASIRKVTEVYATANSNSYGATVTDCTSGMFANTTHDVAKFVTTANYPSGTTLSCRANSTSWAVSASLFGGNYWCVDSSGTPKEVSSAISTTSCPAS